MLHYAKGYLKNRKGIMSSKENDNLQNNSFEQHHKKWFQVELMWADMTVL